MVPKQLELTWPAFDRLRTKWQGKVELQGVSLVTLSFFRDRQAAVELADTVARYRGILGAAVCCSDTGGLASDDWTTCELDRDGLLDYIFELAKERGLLLDFHVDENGNKESKGLRHIAQKTILHGYQDQVVCGHCCSLASQTPEELEKTLALAARARVTVVSLPLVNEWTQDRCQQGRRTPRWRGITTLHELQAAGVSVAMASDNTRDQFYQYGDLDMLEVFTQGVRMGQLDRPISTWPAAVTSIPADAMKVQGGGRIAQGGRADMVLFRARRYSELLSRPQIDRVVVRDGRPISAIPPDYKLLDYDPRTHEYYYRNSEPPAGRFKPHAVASTAVPIAGKAQKAGEASDGTLDGRLRERPRTDMELARGLSMCLPTLAMSSPPSHYGANFERLHKSANRSALLMESCSAHAEPPEEATDQRAGRDRCPPRPPDMLIHRSKRNGHTAHPSPFVSDTGAQTSAPWGPGPCTCDMGASVSGGHNVDKPAAVDVAACFWERRWHLSSLTVMGIALCAASAGAYLGSIRAGRV